MQSTFVTPRYNYCCYPLPTHLHPPCKVIFNSKSRKFLTANRSFLKLTANLCCSKEEEKEQNHRYTDDSLYTNRENRELVHGSGSSEGVPETRLRKSVEEPSAVVDNPWNIFSNMWWANLKAALGQRINLEGIACFAGVLSKNKQLVIPHVTVPDIRYIDWVELKNKGFEGVVFDKDNTLTVPYTLRLWAPLDSSLDLCKSLFGSNVAVLSNSAGLLEYDHDGRKAVALEDAIGIKVIRHRVKKPAGSAEEIESHFGCESSRLIMVGDRPFTDVVYGNRNGFFTILTEPLSHAGEPLIVRQVRWLEGSFLKQLSKRGLRPMSHKLVSDPVKCVKKVHL